MSHYIIEYQKYSGYYYNAYFYKWRIASKTLTALSIISQELSEEKLNMQTPKPMILAEY